MSGKPPRAILWDNDGVLVDTEPIFYQVTSEVLADYGVTLSEELYVDLSLRRGRSLFDLAAERGVDPDEIARSKQERNARYLERLREGVPLLEGVRQSIEALSGKLPMAVVTSSYREHFYAIHRPHGLLGHFEFVLTDGDYPLHKPNPDPYRIAAERLGLDPAECLVVEDSERGLQAAVSAGMRCLVVPRGFTRGGDFASAHRVLETVAEVPAIVAGLGAERV
ncbi:MAG: HAD family phosphatase [Myxococcota bacterium]|nr:HAD family phosphatase [Myxococcota bacterium]